MIFRLLLVTSLFFIPAISLAQVVITEIMYDLEGSDTGREWVEIYNMGTTPVDLTDWKFFENGTNHGLSEYREGPALQGGEYAIIADDPVKFLIDWPGFSGILLDSSWSSFSNTGESLILRDNNLVDQDQVSYLSDWGASGDGNSLQKINNAWVAGLPMPGLANSNGEANQDNSEEVASVPAPLQTGSVIPYVFEPQQTIAAHIQKKETPPVAGAATEFEGIATGLEGKPIDNARFIWNFGDGMTSEGKMVLHTFPYPGEYMVVLDASSGGYSNSDRTKVEVISANISVDQTGTPPDMRVKLLNNSSFEIDLSGWMLWNGSEYFIFPKNTFILEGKTIVFPWEVLGWSNLSASNATLLYPSGKPALVVNPPSDISPKGRFSSESFPKPVTNISQGSNVSRDDGVLVTSHNPDGLSSPVLPAYAEDAAAVASTGSALTRGIAKWIFALSVMTMLSLAGVFFVRRLPQDEHAREGISADEFTIIEDK